MDEKVSVITCRKCKTRLTSTFTECPECGTPTSTLGLFCPNSDCRKPVEPDWEICRSCKTKLYGSSSPLGDETPSSDDGFDAVTLSGHQTASSLKIDLHEGELLDDQYKILKKLDDGGFGSVYEVEDVRFGGKKALKAVVAGDESMTCVPDAIRQEFATHSEIHQIDHVVRADGPRFCRYRELSLVIVAMELADGGDLKQWLARNQNLNQRLTVGLDLFRQACLGVQAIHQAGIAHLDIKPGNILLVGATAKVADFGIGRYCSNQFARNVDALLRRGLGTPEYMSPEQFRAPRPQEIGPASDIYSLGVILFEILDGTRPFIGSPLELQDAHLNMEPPHLKGECEKWSLIVQQCLKKKAQERYSSVELLIADLDRVAEGVAVKVDVSCRECGHTNVLPHMINVKQCEKCGRILPDSFFRECPGYGKILRQDIEVCPFCNRNVEQYYRLIEQRNCIEQVRDEDPVMAIERLNDITTYFRTHGDEINFHERAVHLLNDLESMQPRIGALIQQARRAESDHEPNQAIEFWQEILTIVPRHRTAKKEIQRIGNKVDAFLQDRRKALQLADQGEFEKAETLLEDCDRRIADYQQIRQTLTLCRQRARVFTQSRRQMEKALEARQLKEAQAFVEAGLSAAPNCEALLILKTDLLEKTEYVQQRVAEIKEYLDQCEVVRADRELHEIESIQADNELGMKLREQITELYRRYEEFFSDAQAAFRKHCLSKAAELVREALECVPQSSKVDEFLAGIEVQKQQASDLIKQAQASLPGADFEKSRSLFQQSLGIWADQPKADDVRSQIDSMESCYKSHLAHARECLKCHQLDQACDHVKEAEKVCPQSSVIKTLVTQIDEQKTQARSLIKQAKENLPFAEFELASQFLCDAKDLWPNMPEIEEAVKAYEKTRSDYEAAYHKAKQDAEAGQLESAIRHADRMKEICPQSEWVTAFKTEMLDRQDQARELLGKTSGLLSQADFDGCDSQLKEAENLWSTLQEVKEKRKELDHIRKAYKAEIEQAEKNKSSHQYDEALKHILCARSLCPDSSHASKLLHDIKQGYLERKLSLIKDKIQSADFHTAQTLLQEVRQISPEHPDLEEYQRQLVSVRQPYEELMQKADLKTTGNADAIAYLKEALRFCPQSKDPVNKIREIRRKEKRSAFWKYFREKFFTWTFILAAAIIAFKVTFSAYEQVGLLNTIIVLLAVLTNMMLNTNICRRIESINYVRNKIEVFGVMFGILCLLSAALLYLLPQPYLVLTLPILVVLYPLRVPAGRYFVKVSGYFLSIVHLRAFKIVSSLTAVVFVIAIGFYYHSRRPPSKELEQQVTYEYSSSSDPENTRTDVTRPAGADRMFSQKLTPMPEKSTADSEVKGSTVEKASDVTYPALESKDMLLGGDGTSGSERIDYQEPDPEPDKTDTEAKVVKSVEPPVKVENKEFLVLLNQSADYLKNSDYAQASDYIDRALVILPEDKRALEIRNMIEKEQQDRQRFDAYTATARDLYFSGKLREARDHYHRALDIFDDRDVRGQIEEIDKRINEFNICLKKGIAAAADLADPAQAMQMYESARRIWDCPEAQAALSSLVDRGTFEIDQKLAQVSALMDTARLESAFHLAEESLKLAGTLDLKDKSTEILKIMDKIKWSINPGNLDWDKISLQETEIVDEQGQVETRPIRYYYNAAQMRFVYIDHPDEGMGGYYISATEVTKDQWLSVKPNCPEWFEGIHIPVSGISWDEALKFCSELSKQDGIDYKLPTRLQWEYACRRDTDMPYCFGYTISRTYANFSPSAGDSVRPVSVGSYPANARGLFDMHGNVSEWCRDKKDRLRMILKGGSYRDNYDKIHASFIDSDSPRGKAKYYGLRLVIEIQD